MNNLKNLKNSITKIKLNLKGIDNIKELFKLSNELKKVLNNEELKTTVKNLKGDLYINLKGIENNEAIKLFDKVDWYNTFIYHTDKLQNLINEFEQSENPEKVKKVISQHYTSFLNTVENSKGRGNITKLFKLLQECLFNWLTQQSKLINPQQQSEDLTKLINLDNETDKLKQEQTKKLQDLKTKYQQDKKKIKNNTNKKIKPKEAQKTKLRQRLKIEQPKELNPIKEVKPIQETKPTEEIKQPQEVKAINEVKPIQETKPTEELKDYKAEFKKLVSEAVRETIRELNPFNKVKKLISSISYGIHHTKKHLRGDRSEGITIVVKKEDPAKVLRKYLKHCRAARIQPSAQTIRSLTRKIEEINGQ